MQWYYHNRGRERGPVPFRELIARVRGGELTECDLVRAEYMEESQLAGTVPGLFYLARREEAAGAVIRADRPSSPAAECRHREGGIVRRWLVTLSPPAMLRLGASFAGACLAFGAVQHWSAREAHRFPGLFPDNVRAFPFVGECHIAEYCVFVADLVFLAAVAAYFFAGWIHNRLE